MARRRRAIARAEYWPSFVDVLTNLLLVFIFLLSIFALVQFLLSREISGKDTVLNRLNAQIAELTEMLALEKAGKGELTDNLATLQASLAAAESERDRLQGLLDSQSDVANSAGEPRSPRSPPISTHEKRRQPAGALPGRTAQPADLGAPPPDRGAWRPPSAPPRIATRRARPRSPISARRLNVALAQRVQELSRYRSDFFGRLREILGDRPDIRVVGDRFVFQSEVLFATGSDEINAEGDDRARQARRRRQRADRGDPARTFRWVLQVNGHTDKRPITGTGGRFQSNWDLSAARAISVVRYLVDKGIPPDHLVAAGYGEFQPIEEGDSEEALSKNRRIELKLTEQ